MMGSALPLHVERSGREASGGVPTFLLIHGYGASSFISFESIHLRTYRFYFVFVHNIAFLPIVLAR
jgi:hypothetical protein